MLKQKTAALEAAKLLEKDKELYIKQTTEAAEHERQIALESAEADQANKLAQLNLTIATYASTFYQNGKKLYAEGRLVEALDDLNRSLKLVPDFEWANYLAGTINYEQRRYDKAIAHFKNLLSNASDPLKPYAMLRLYLAEMMSKGESQALQDFGLKVAWPVPVFELYEGKISPEECLAKARSPKTKLKNGQLCSAHYYIAEYYFIKGNAYEGIRNLKKAIEYDTDWMEHLFARSRLGAYAATSQN
ncbi:hypothetical protein BVX99_03135 [bacterium F16]|nr:hypothetical protein BVX99_03135 [bacterium F16]